MGGDGMHCCVQMTDTTVIIWVPRYTPADIVQDYVARYQMIGYQIVVYYSGASDVVELTQMLLHHNLVL